MNSRVGRQKVDNPKDIDVKVRIDRKTNEQLLSFCEKNKTTRTEAIRNGIIRLLSEEKDK